MGAPSPAVALKAPTRDIALWAAGFFEGEGTCRLHPGGSPQVGLAQQNIEPLVKLAIHYGGALSPNMKPVGFSSKPIWTLQLYGPRARVFLESIFPHLSERRQVQVRLALSMEES